MYMYMYTYIIQKQVSVQQAVCYGNSSATATAF